MIIFAKAHWKSILWAFFIFILCHLPGKDLPQVDIMGIDKIVHFTLFAILTYLFLFMEEQKTLTAIWLVFFILYGGLLEIYQGKYIMDRTADVFDFVANSIGVISVFVYYLIRKK